MAFEFQYTPSSTGAATSAGMAIGQNRRANALQAEQFNQMRVQKQKENALNQIFSSSVDPVSGKMNMENALTKMYQSGLGQEAHAIEMKMKDTDMRRLQLGQRPSAVQTYEYFKGLPQSEQETMLRTMRGPKYGEVGGVQSEMPALPGQQARPLTTLQQEAAAQAQIAGAKAGASAGGVEEGKQEALLKDMEANLPRLEEVVSQLGVLGKTATYTATGQVADIAMREAGMQPRDSAVARKEYISKVDNEVLPLLRQTFGAAFTEREGQSLKATLGDPNASPSEKDAVLKSFIDSKRAQIQTMKRRLGQPDEQAQPAQPKTMQAPKAAIDYLMKNNSQIMRQQFKQKFGYLPEGM